MKKMLISTAVVAVLCSPAFAQLSKEDAIKKAETVLESFKAGKTADIVKELDATMTQALPEAKLEEVWTGLGAQVGAFKAVDERREGQIQGMQAVELILSFEKDRLVMRTVLGKDGKIAGLFFQPVASALLPAGK